MALDDPPETALAPASPILSHHVLTESLARRIHHLMTTLKDRLVTPWPSRSTLVHTSHAAPVDVSHAPPIHVDIPLADLVEFQELLAWWRQRKYLLSLAAEAPAPTERWTLYIEKPFIERIKAEAEAERVKVTEVINRIIRHYYACRQVSTRVDTSAGQPRDETVRLP
jgi:hypothetical protein